MDWYSIDPPDWYLGEGWALTPETAGTAREDGRGPGTGPIQGWIRRWQTNSSLLIGGRNLSASGQSAEVRISIDGRVVDQISVAPGFFLRMIDLPAAPADTSGDYATVAITAQAAGERGEPDVAIEQFDAKPAGAVIFGYAEGWHEHEYDPATGRLWRWTSERALLRVRSGGRPLALRLEGETETFDTPSRVTIRAGEQVLGEISAGRTFSAVVPLPSELFERGESTITIQTDQTYVPAELRPGRSNDRRRLGLKVYDCSIREAS
jgi:hypothetical protein